MDSSGLPCPGFTRLKPTCLFVTYVTPNQACAVRLHTDTGVSAAMRHTAVTTVHASGRFLGAALFPASGACRKAYPNPLQAALSQPYLQCHEFPFYKRSAATTCINDWRPCLHLHTRALVHTLQFMEGTRHIFGDGACLRLWPGR